MDSVEDEQLPFMSNLALPTDARAPSFKLREVSMMEGLIRRDYEQLEKLATTEAIVAKLQKTADLKPVLEVDSPLSKTRKFLFATRNWIQVVALSDVWDVSFFKPERHLIAFGHNSTELSSPLLENCLDRHNTAVKDHFSFRSKEEVICDDAVDSPFDSIDTESDVQGLDHGSSAISSKLAEAKHADERERTDAINDEDDLVARYASFFKQQIQDALEPLRGHVALLFQTRGEAERKRRKHFLALEEKKLALRRKRIQALKRRRGGQGQRRRRASPAKSSRPTLRQKWFPN